MTAQQPTAAGRRLDLSFPTAIYNEHMCWVRSIGVNLSILVLRVGWSEARLCLISWKAVSWRFTQRHPGVDPPCSWQGLLGRSWPTSLVPTQSMTADALTKSMLAPPMMELLSSGTTSFHNEENHPDHAVVAYSSVHRGETL